MIIESSPPERWDNSDVPMLVSLEQLDSDLFRNRVNQINLNGTLFGGQVLAQSLAAAAATVSDRQVHSMHGYFLRTGRGDSRILFQVERTRDGGRFSTRRVTALQESRAIFHMECSFRETEPGFEHQFKMPDVPPPEDLPDLVALAASDADTPLAAMARKFSLLGPIMLRPVDHEALFRPSAEPRRRAWFRCSGAERSGNQAEHRQMLAFMSDFWLSGTMLVPHIAQVPQSGIMMASVDHAIWFHGDVRVDDWLLYDLDSPAAMGGTGVSRGMIYDRAGRLVASTVQETLARARRD